MALGVIARQFFCKGDGFGRTLGVVFPALNFDTGLAFTIAGPLQLGDQRGLFEL